MLRRKWTRRLNSSDIICNLYMLWGLCWFHSTLKINKSMPYVQLDFDFDYTAMPRIGKRGNSGCDSDGMAVCKH